MNEFVKAPGMAGRPSNQEERYHQVMGAMVRCVARYGLDGATLERIAKEADLSRPLIRHHLGNRDEVLHKLKSYVLDAFGKRTEELFSRLPEENQIQAMLDALFAEGRGDNADMVLAFAALTARAGEEADLQEDCRAWILDFENKIASVLAAEIGAADKRELAIAATGIAAIYFNVAALAALNMPANWRDASKRAAYQLQRSVRVKR